MRILGWYVALLAIALVVGLLIQRAYLFNQVRADADRLLEQEVEEMRVLAAGVDPRTQEPFAGDLEAIFNTFIERNVPLANEAVVTILDGSPHRHDIGGAVFRNTDLLDHWAALTTTERGESDNDNGPVRWLAVPVLSDETTQAGVFVAAVFMQSQMDYVTGVVRIGALVLGSILLLATAAAWLVAGEVLKPLRLLNETARSISDTDLANRIQVEGDDEVADVAKTFNDMLDRLEEAFDTQRRFVDDASHELRTPITVIRGQLELLGDDPNDREATMTLVNGELDRMSRIVDDLLILARSERPDFIAPQPIDLAEFIEEMAVKASSLTGTDVAVGAVQPAVFVADKQRLTQAVTNLARNATEHGPDGAQVTIGGSIARDEVRITVSDNGPGIDPEVREHLFERFYRGRSGRRSTDGAGLGLPIVRAITEAHGGRVDLDTGEGGTTFTLVLPIIQDSSTWPGS